MKRSVTSRKAFVISVAALAWVVAMAGAAFASYPPTTTPPPRVPPRPPIPFTGANVSAGFIILVVLLVVGSALVAAGRRRRAGASK